ncbi:RDD family protein [Nocardioides dilutus]
MSTNEPPTGAPGEPTPPPAAPDPGQSAAPPPPPPPASTPPPPAASAPPPAAAMAQGVPRPGELVDRFLAKLIDGVILGVIYAIIAGIVGGALITGYRSGSEVYFYYLIIGVLSAVLYTGYFAYMESSRGQTVGKIVMKLKVFGPDGVSNPTMEQAIRRNIWAAAGIISVIPFVWWLSGLAQLAAVILIAVGINGDPVKRQHWFDKFAGGTQVMKIG